MAEPEPIQPLQMTSLGDLLIKQALLFSGISRDDWEAAPASVRARLRDALKWLAAIQDALKIAVRPELIVEAGRAATTQEDAVAFVESLAATVEKATATKGFYRLVARRVAAHANAFERPLLIATLKPIQAELKQLRKVKLPAALEQIAEDRSAILNAQLAGRLGHHDLELRPADLLALAGPGASVASVADTVLYRRFGGHLSIDDIKRRMPRHRPRGQT